MSVHRFVVEIDEFSNGFWTVWASFDVMREGYAIALDKAKSTAVAWSEHSDVRILEVREVRYHD
jgi:hypothetical protein